MVIVLKGGFAHCLVAGVASVARAKVLRRLDTRKTVNQAALPEFCFQYIREQMSIQKTDVLLNLIYSPLPNLGPNHQRQVLSV